MERKKVTIAELQQKKTMGKKMTMMTAYDYPTGHLVDQAGMVVPGIREPLGPQVAAQVAVEPERPVGHRAEWNVPLREPGR